MDIGALTVPHGDEPGEDHVDRGDHLDDDRADRADRELREAVELADQLGVETVTCFSGLPAGAPGDAYWAE